MVEIACRLCGGYTRSLFREKVLGKYDVQYVVCADCELIQTEPPYWLEEAYSSAISLLDTGLLGRNIALSRQLVCIIPAFYENFATLKILDYSSGYGVLPRLMRDIGFDFYWHDVYCNNIFAKQFEAKNDDHFQLITCFEVLEHLPSPQKDIVEIFSHTKCETMIFSTVLYGAVPPDKNWWYYIFESGQHVAIYNDKTLKFIAQQLGVNLCSFNQNLHIFTKKEIPISAIEKTLKDPSTYSRISSQLTSKTFSDHLLMREALQSGNLSR